MRAVTTIVRHRSFDAESYNNDIALLKLRKPVTFSKIIKPVCLPPASKLLCKQNTALAIMKFLDKYLDISLSYIYSNVWDRFVLNILITLFSGVDPSGKEGIVVGWGRTSEGGQLPAIVQEVRVPILSLTQCRGMKYRASRITNNMVCGLNFF